MHLNLIHVVCAFALELYEVPLVTAAAEWWVVWTLAWGCLGFYLILTLPFLTITFSMLLGFHSYCYSLQSAPVLV